ncbi:MAG TPA: hypothetical protein VJ183_18480 [Chloroflexia bacterium]|nr:hypothetical protein [Chloroflexia bacterium]
MSNGNRGRVAVKQACTVLYNTLPPLDAARLRGILQRLVGPCEVEWGGALGPDKPMVAGVVRFDGHQIVLVAFDAPVREEVLARTVGVSPMPEEQRHTLMSHRAAIRVLYMEGTTGPVEQLMATYQVATALLSQGGLGILNERASLAQPLELLVNYLPPRSDEIPPLQLWVGVVTFGIGEETEDEPQRYLMRTYGMEQMALPELGIYITDRSAADEVYDTLLNIGLYLVEGGEKLQIGPGHRAEFRGHTYLFTDPDQEGFEFASPTGLLMLVQI